MIKWTPKAEGNFAVAVKVSDGVLYIIQSFPITVSKPPAPPPIVNYAPIITSIPGNTAIIGVAYLYDVNATDPNGDVLTYSLTKKPVGMTINPTTGLISWTPKQIGANAVIVKVSDGKKATTQSFTITVKAVEPDPEIVLTGIEVDPKTMSLFVGESEAIKSVTATYEIKGLEVLIPLGECEYVSDPTGIVTVSDVGLVTADAEGLATITVEYKGNTEEITVTVSEKVVKKITIRWLEDAVRYYPDGTLKQEWSNDPIPPLDPNDKTKLLPPAILIQDNGGYHFADIQDYYNWLLIDIEGSLVISGTGELSGYATYTFPAVTPLPTEDNFVGQVVISEGKIINWSEVESNKKPAEIPYDYDGVMVGTYTQWSYKFGTEEDVHAVYPLATLCEGFDDKWLVGYTNYIAHGGK
ncbi:hypothetical protein ES705_35043 [subsurface metagenome]